MATYKYSVSTNTIWTSFDFGEIEAESLEEARELAIEKLEDDFKKANEALAHCDNTNGFTLSFDKGGVTVEQAYPLFYVSRENCPSYLRVTEGKTLKIQFFEKGVIIRLMEEPFVLKNWDVERSTEAVFSKAFSKAVNLIPAK